MARCSHLHSINPDAVTLESESCRHLIAHHVDERPDEFSLLASAKRLKDFSRTHLVGVVGAGVAYLQMIRDGYVWCDHFENQLLLQTAPTKRSPDFVFSRPNHADVAITESKATHGMPTNLNVPFLVMKNLSTLAPPTVHLPVSLSSVIETTPV